MIWTPFGDRCRNCGRRKRRTYNPLKFAVGDRLLDADGNVILDDDGNVMLDDGAGNDCCCTPLPDCSPCCSSAPCYSSTPTMVSVSFSGLSGCSGCVTPVVFSSLWPKSWNITFLLSGTYDLPCIEIMDATYIKHFPGNYGTLYWDNTTCSGPGETVDDLVIFCGWDHNTNAWTILANLGSPLYGHKMNLFYSSFTHPGNCTSLGSCTNELTACSFNYSIGYMRPNGGGTATAVYL